MSKPVFYTSEMAGFPAGNTRVAGGIIAVLDACLVTGANLTTATNVTQVGGTATAVFAGNHNFSVGDSVLVEGATPTAYNGLVKVTAKTSASISWAIDSGTASPATGTITVKHPGAGWTKSWADTNMAAYRSATSDNGIGAYIQIEDNNPYSNGHASFRWRVCEGHTALNTATRLVTELRPFYKIGGTSNWWCVADDRMVYLTMLGTASNSNTLFSFGEIIRMISTDSGTWVFPANGTTSDWQMGGYGVYTGTRSDRPQNDYTYQCLNSWSGLPITPLVSPTITGSNVDNGDTSLSLATAQRSGASPNPLTGAIEILPVRAVEQVNTSVARGSTLTRGVFPGTYHPVGLTSNLFFNSIRNGVLSNVEVNGSLRDILLTRCAYDAQAQGAFDLTGPWR